MMQSDTLRIENAFKVFAHADETTSSDQYLKLFIDALMIGQLDINSYLKEASNAEVPKARELIHNVVILCQHLMQRLQCMLIELGYTPSSARENAYRVGIKPVFFASSVLLMMQDELDMENLEIEFWTVYPGIVTYLTDQAMDWELAYGKTSPMTEMIHDFTGRLQADSRFLENHFYSLLTEHEDEEHQDSLLLKLLRPYVAFLEAHHVGQADIRVVLKTISDILTGEVMAQGIRTNRPYVDWLSQQSPALGDLLHLDHTQVHSMVSNVGITMVAAVLSVRDVMKGRVESAQLAELFNSESLAIATSLANMVTRLVDDMGDYDEDMLLNAPNIIQVFRETASKIDTIFHPLYELEPVTVEAFLSEFVDSETVYNSVDVNLLLREMSIQRLADIANASDNPAFRLLVKRIMCILHVTSVNGITSDEMMERISASLMNPNQQRQSA